MQEQPRHPLLSRFWAPDATTTNDDLALAKEKVKQLEAALSQLQNKLKDEEIGKQILECKLQKQHIDLTSTIEQLVDQKTNAEARAVYHKKSADHASETLKAIKDQHNIELGKRDNALSEARRLRDEDAQRIEQLETQVQELQRREAYHIQAHVEPTDNESVQHALKTMEEMSASLKDWQNKATEHYAKLKELEIENHDLRAKQSDNNVLMNVQQMEHERIRKLETENAMLRRRTGDINEHVALREKVHRLERQAKYADTLLDVKCKLEVENAFLRAERLEWSQYLDNENSPFTTPADLVYNLVRRLQKQDTLEAQCAILQKSSKELNDNLKKLEEENISLRKENEQLQKLVRERGFNDKRSNDQRELLQRRCDIYEAQYDTLARLQSQLSGKEGETIPSHEVVELRKLIKENEQYIENLRSELASVRLELAQKQQPGASDTQKSVLLSSLVESLTSQNDSTTLELRQAYNQLALTNKELDTQKERASLLLQTMKKHEAELRKSDEEKEQGDQKSQIEQQQQQQQQPVQSTETEGKGERVLALVENPASKEHGIRQERLTQLEKENQQLLDMLEATSSPTEDEPRKRQRLEQDTEQASVYITVPQTSLDNLRRKAEILNDNIAAKDKRIMRLHQVFEEKLSDYDCLMRNLFGYTVELLDKNRICLTSIYAPSDSFSLLYVRNAGIKDSLRIIGPQSSEYMRTFDGLYRTHILTAECLPCFVSSVTVELCISSSGGRWGGLEDVEHTDITMDDTEETNDIEEQYMDENESEGHFTEPAGSEYEQYEYENMEDNGDEYYDPADENADETLPEALEEEDQEAEESQYPPDWQYQESSAYDDYDDNMPEDNDVQEEYVEEDDENNEDTPGHQTKLPPQDDNGVFVIDDDDD